MKDFKEFLLDEGLSGGIIQKEIKELLKKNKTGLTSKQAYDKLKKTGNLPYTLRQIDAIMGQMYIDDAIGMNSDIKDKIDPNDLKPMPKVTTPIKQVFFYKR